VASGMVERVPEAAQDLSQQKKIIVTASGRFPLVITTLLTSP
jgi:hypothetical protein